MGGGLSRTLMRLTPKLKPPAGLINDIQLGLISRTWKTKVMIKPVCLGGGRGRRGRLGVIERQARFKVSRWSSSL